MTKPTSRSGGRVIKVPTISFFFLFPQREGTIRGVLGLAEHEYPNCGRVVEDWGWDEAEGMRDTCVAEDNHVVMGL